jgi:hypothetical protein
MTVPPDLRTLTEVEKDALIRALWAQVRTLTARVAELQARPNQPPKTPGNSSLPPSRGHKANRPEKAKRPGPRQGSLGRAGGGRPLAEEPDQLVIAKAAQMWGRLRPFWQPRSEMFRSGRISQQDCWNMIIPGYPSHLQMKH